MPDGPPEGGVVCAGPRRSFNMVVMSSDDVKVTAAPAARPKQRRMRDMALSMAVLLVPLAIFYLAWNWGASDRQVSVADTREDYFAAESLGLEVIRPDLAEEWKPISTALVNEDDVVTLRTGWYSPEGDGLQLVQTTGDAALVDEELTGSGGRVEAGGIEWTSYPTSDGESWVADVADSTVILAADSDGSDELAELAEGVGESLTG